MGPGGAAQGSVFFDCAGPVIKMHFGMSEDWLND